MKKFLVLFNAPSEEFQKMMANSTPEQRQAGMDEWKTWMDSHKDAFVDLGGPVGKNMRVTSEGIKEARNEVGGYSIMQAESAEALAKMFEGFDHFQIPRSYIEVMEIVPM